MEKTPHILIVDDDREIRDLLSRFLQKHGFRASAAADAACASVNRPNPPMRAAPAAAVVPRNPRRLMGSIVSSLLPLAAALELHDPRHAFGNREETGASAELFHYRRRNHPVQGGGP